MSNSVNLKRRAAGLLLHPTSLPGVGESGVLGADAYRFVDLLAESGMSLWQALPLTPTHGDRSPYQSLSVHACSEELICRHWLAARGWLSAEQLTGSILECLALACAAFHQKASAEERQAFADFTAAHAYWLEDYALYRAIRADEGLKCWVDWPAPLRDRDAKALEKAAKRLEQEIRKYKFGQYVAFTQWLGVKRYANERGIAMFGDMPIFVSYDSADVWAQREYFRLDRDGRMEVVAGVPPDYFSATGQRWGNPHYNWEQMQADGFEWWQNRLRSQMQLFDVIRIDHFRGFEAYWEIPASEPTAINGRWVKAPGEELFKCLKSEFGEIPLVAEDLGVITEEVNALRKGFELPGMKILQFAFDGGPDNPYLPHNHETCCVVYTGTHDNDTTCGWFTALKEPQRLSVLEYLGLPDEPMPWPLNRAALASVAQWSILPMQDVLGLDGSHRMNTPGTQQGNWLWRFSWDMVPETLAKRLRHLNHLYGRI
ncbi:MAG: 4-alpha-glucanotransferase [Pseudomonadota bacterium]